MSQAIIQPPTLVDPSGRPLTTREQYDVATLKIPNVELVGPRLLVYPPPRKEQQTATGLIIPKSAEDTAREAMVLLVGEPVMLADGTLLEQRFAPGQVVVYAPYSGIDFEMDGFKYLLIQQSDVRLILTYKGIGLKFDDEEAG